MAQSNRKHKRVWRRTGSWPSRRGHVRVRQRRRNPAVGRMQRTHRPYTTLPLCERPFSQSFSLSGADGPDGLNNSTSLSVSRLTLIFLLPFTLLLSRNVRAQVTFVASAIPLAVRSPYLNCWLYNRDAPIFGQTWPTTLNQSQVCHACIVRWP